jgi:hypothetical protein
LALKQGLSTGYFNQPALISGNTIHYFGKFHIYPLFVSISGVAIGTSEVATGKPYEYAGTAAVCGFSLYAVKYFVN